MKNSLWWRQQRTFTLKTRKKPRCRWFKADVPGHIESACGVWVEGTPLDIVFAEMKGKTCHICGGRIKWSPIRLSKTEEVSSE